MIDICWCWWRLGYFNTLSVLRIGIIRMFTWRIDTHVSCCLLPLRVKFHIFDKIPPIYNRKCVNLNTIFCLWSDLPGDLTYFRSYNKSNKYYSLWVVFFKTYNYKFWIYESKFMCFSKILKVSDYIIRINIFGILKGLWEERKLEKVSA